MSNAPRGFPMWLLLLPVLPVALAIGWFAGNLDGPPRKPEPVAAREPAQAPAVAPVASSGVEPSPEPVADHAPSTMEWKTLAAATDESRRTGKPVLIDFSADWCPPCQRMKRQVFEVPEHARAIQTDVIPVAIVDRVRENGRNSVEVEELYRQFEVQGFPTLVVYSPATGRAVQTSGFGGAGSTREWVTWAVQSVR